MSDQAKVSGLKERKDHVCGQLALSPALAVVAFGWASVARNGDDAIGVEMLLAVIGERIGRRFNASLVSQPVHIPETSSQAPEAVGSENAMACGRS